MTSDEANAAEAEEEGQSAAWPTLDLPDPKEDKKVLFNIRSLRDFGAASAVGSATVAISLLIGNGQVAVEAFYVLMGIQIALIYLTQYFYGRLVLIRSFTATRLFRFSPFSYIFILIPILILSGAQAYLMLQLKQHGSSVGTSTWWALLAAAGAGAMLGLFFRRAAESALEVIDDEVWKRRLDQILEAQKQATHDISSRVSDFYATWLQTRPR